MDKIPLYNNTSPKSAVLRTVICSLSALAITVCICYTVSKLFESERMRERMYLDAFSAYRSVPDDGGYSQKEAENIITSLTEVPLITESSAVTEKEPSALIPEKDKARITDDDSFRRSVQTDCDKTSSDAVFEYAIYPKTLPFENASDDSLKNAPFVFDKTSSVLILTSIPNESFNSVSDTLTSAKQEENITSFLPVFESIFAASGIKTVICKSLGEAKAALSQSSSISLVIDLRREMLLTNDGRLVRSLVYIDASSAAQVLITVKNDSPESFAFADALASEMSEIPHFSRGVCLSDANISDYCNINLPCVTMYIGTAGNTMSEAAKSARISAACAVGALISHSGD